jgi:hypothetical protein
MRAPDIRCCWRYSSATSSRDEPLTYTEAEWPPTRGLLGNESEEFPGKLRAPEEDHKGFSSAERCWKLVREPQVRTNRETLVVCSEVIGFLTTVESCPLPVSFPEAMAAFASELRIGVVGLASRAAFSLSTAGPRRRLVAQLTQISTCRIELPEWHWVSSAMNRPPRGSLSGGFHAAGTVTVAMLSPGSGTRNPCSRIASM